MITKSRISNKRTALTAALQAGAARDYAMVKSRRQFKKEKTAKTAYAPGTLGLSVVATAIKKQYGDIISRADRKALAKHTGQSPTLFYSHQ